MKLNEAVIQNIFQPIDEQQKEARLDSFAIVKLFLENQALSKKIDANPNKEFQLEELGEIVSKILTFLTSFLQLES